MRMSQLFLRTLRDDPADAEVDSHRLLVRAGYIRKVASGFYTWLPLGYRVLRKVEQIVREEMDAAGAQELWLPIAQPLDLWARTRRDVDYGPLMFRLEDRKEAGYCLSPTAEELMTVTLAAEYSSYRDLPVTLYQINWKYRDELRPRFGLLRGREFLMKDAYSFDVDEDGLKQSYQAMFDAYSRVFERCGLEFRSVRAQSGEIGGDVSQEFMAVAEVGEDDFVWCPSCEYAANTEAATRQPPDAGDASADVPPMQEEHTPGLPGIAGVAEHLGVEHGEMMKCITFAIADGDGDGELGLALVPGDREVNPFALEKAVSPKSARIYGDNDFEAHPEIPKGYIGPHYEGAALVVADPLVRAQRAWVTGANRVDHHVRNAVLDRDFRVDVWTDLVVVEPGDPCPRCGSPLAIDRGIEVGHVFQLGTKYTEALDARYTDESGEQHPIVMGTYGIGVSRVVAAVVEQYHDDKGLMWPAQLAPYDVHLVVLPGKGDATADVLSAADRLYADLRDAGVEVLYDDRDASPGVKFADAELLGMPLRLTLGAKGHARGVVELRRRESDEDAELAFDDVVAGVVAAR